MAWEVKPYPEWSWSHSRDLLFRECRRKYYYQYYGSHNGWLQDASPEAARLYRLKQLQSLYLLFGDVVHQMADMFIGRWERDKTAFSEAELLTRVRNLMNQAVKQSRDLDEWWTAPKRKKMLFEMFYFRKLPATLVEEIRERMQRCLTHFLESKSLQEIILNEEYKLVELEKLNMFSLRKEKVYVKLDALYQHRDGRYVIVDWKTGYEDERIEEQLQLYAYYLVEHYGVPVDQIEIRTEYLLTGKCQVSTVDDQGLEQLDRKIVDSVAEMRAVLEDAAENKPLPVESFAAAEDEKACKWCNFRDACDVKHM